MADVKSVMAEALGMRREISRLLKLSTYNQYDDLSELKINYEDAEQLFLRDELRSIMDKLADVEDKLRYLSWPIVETSRLWKNEVGKYETSHGHYYSCGSRIEALVSDDYHEAPYWTRTRVEHDGTDYYLVGHRDVSLDGLTVRVRKEAA